MLIYSLPTYHREIINTNVRSFKKLYDVSGQGASVLILMLQKCLIKAQRRLRKGVIDPGHVVTFLSRRWCQRPITDGFTFTAASSASPGNLVTVITYIKVLQRWRFVIMRGQLLPPRASLSPYVPAGKDLVFLSPTWERLASVIGIYGDEWERHLRARLDKSFNLSIHLPLSYHLVYVTPVTLERVFRGKRNLDDIDKEIYVWRLDFVDSTNVQTTFLYLPFCDDDNVVYYQVFEHKPTKTFFFSDSSTVEALTRYIPGLYWAQYYYFQSPRAYLAMRQLNKI